MNYDIFGQEMDEVKQPIVTLTCNSCDHRQRWQCNSKVFQYCGVRKSKRTDNGLLKIKCKTPACPLYKSIPHTKPD
jgi:hypothetical protein